MDDDFIPSDQDPKRLTNRNDRIEYLVNLAKILLENNKKHDEILQILDNKMVSLWSLSQSTRKDYRDSVIIRIKELCSVELKQNLHQKPASKQYMFMHTLRTMQEDAGTAEEDALLERLVIAGFPDKTAATMYLQKMCKEGVIFEPKSGFYKIP